MRYVRLINGVPTAYSLSQLRADFANTSFPAEPSDELLAAYSVYPLTETARPNYDPLTEKPTETTPVEVDGVWTQQWQVVALTEDELNLRRERTSVSMRQARLALLQQGLLAQVEAALAALPDGQREAAQIEWEYGSTVARLSPWVVQLTAGLGLTPAEVDQLFALAETL